MELPNIAKRFLKYVTYDTQSDSTSTTFPTTQKQLVLLKELKQELEQIELEKVLMDSFGYVTAELASNSEKEVPTIAFFAHVDTADEVSGANVKAIVHQNYQGQDIILPGDKTQILSSLQSPYLLNLIGHDIITTDGTTLLGADDKSGIAVIMTAIEFLKNNPQIKHGKIKIAFNPDEEVGQGMDYFNIENFGANFAYTLDGSDKGEIQYENFYAKSAVVTFKGKSIHPGYAKDTMINAVKIASHFVNLLPYEDSPEGTEGKKGFVYPLKVSGECEIATVEMIMREFDKEKLFELEEMIRQKTNEVIKKFPGATFELEIKEQYNNMFEIIQKDMRVIDYAKEAMLRLGIKPKVEPIRGGTDGARLTYMGLPCPNLFTGMQNYHGKQEYISVQDMEEAVKTVVEIAKVWEEKS